MALAMQKVRKQSPGR